MSSDQNMTQAVILAGGAGRRLYPYTSEIPKPLVEIRGTPIIEILIKCLKKSGITDLHVAVNHRAEQIERALGDGSHLGVTLAYIREEKPLSTVGPLKLIDNLPEDFLVVNGDVLTDLDFGAFFERHRIGAASLTVATCKRKSRIDYGTLELTEDGSVRAFREKPQHEYIVSMGVYCYRRSLLDIVPDNTAYGFDQLISVMLEGNQRVNTFHHDGYWLDVGRPEDLEQANADWEIVQRFAGLSV